MASAHKSILAEKSARQHFNSAPAQPAVVQQSVLTEEMLVRFDSRAATYDRENRGEATLNHNH
jgi:hypothetical protein